LQEGCWQLMLILPYTYLEPFLRYCYGLGLLCWTLTERALDSGWIRCAAISDRARVRI